jgi:hypothetical protein
MRKLMLVVAALFVAVSASAQDWIVNGGGAGTIVYNGGNVGIGTGASAPGGRLDIKQNTSADVLMRVWNNGTGGAKMRFVAADGKEARYQVTHGSSFTAEMIAVNSPGSFNNNAIRFRVLGPSDVNNEEGLAAATRMTILGNGNVGIGVTSPTFKLHVNGTGHFTGALTGANIAATYQDIAEWVPATADLAPGTVVVLNTEADNQVMASHQAYDTRVAGVVSHQPGISLGIAGSDKEQIATTGRVLVNVDATKSPIKVGDLLVSSDLPGVAMKSEPMDINGRKFHQPGTIIGKALQSLDTGKGQILVLLSMQ